MAALDSFFGCLAASLFSVAYYVVPIWLVAATCLAVSYPFWWFTWLLALPVVVSALLPPFPSRTFLRSWPFKHIPTYFDYEEHKETSDEDTKDLMHSRKVLFCVQPHGVFSFGGACAGVEWSKKWWRPEECPTAAANVVSKIPLLKHIVGVFGLCDASSKGLQRTLKQKSVVLYIGGIAELFLSSTSQEILFIKKRKGFIKLALRTGAEIVPIYFFGNTSVLSVLKSAWLRKFARSTGVSATIFWGRWFLPIPEQKKIVGVIGKPLGIPSEPSPEPTQAQIDKFHSLYVAEIQRIFEQYKKTNPDYAHKSLQFES